MNLDVRYKSCAVYMIHSVNMKLIKLSIDLDSPQNENIFEGMSREICSTVGFYIRISRQLEYFCLLKERARIAGGDYASKLCGLDKKVSLEFS